MSRLVITALALVLALPTMADETTEREVQHLLEFVEASGCTFQRNGTDHDSADAADHLRLKYSRGGSYVNSADQFVGLLATQSSWSGKPYTVTCDGETLPSSEWLRTELAAYRKASPP